MRTICALALAVVLSSNTIAYAQETAYDEDNEAPPPDTLGLNAGLEFGFLSASSIWDIQGDRQDLPDGFSNNSLYLLLRGQYDVAPVPGLYVGVELPFVSNTQEFTSDAGMAFDLSGSSIGDIGLFAGYRAKDTVPDLLDTYGQLRLKLPTGSFDDLAADEIATGDGSTHLHFTVGADATLPANLRAHVDLGYIFTLGFSQTDNGVTSDVNPGDVLFANLAFGYLIEEMVEPRLVVNFASSGSLRSGPEGGDLVEAVGSESSFVTLGLEVFVQIDETFRGKIGWGSQLVPGGLYLPFGGLVLAGDNIFGGPLNVNLGIEASF